MLLGPTTVCGCAAGIRHNLSLSLSLTLRWTSQWACLCVGECSGLRWWEDVESKREGERESGALCILHEASQHAMIYWWERWIEPIYPRRDCSVVPAMISTSFFLLDAPARIKLTNAGIASSRGAPPTGIYALLRSRAINALSDRGRGPGRVSMGFSLSLSRFRSLSFLSFKAWRSHSWKHVARGHTDIKV